MGADYTVAHPFVNWRGRSFCEIMDNARANGCGLSVS